MNQIDHRPSPEQVRAAAAVLKQFAAETRGTASDTLNEKAIYSIAAALGFPGEPSMEYAEAVRHATSGDVTVKPMVRELGDGGYEIVAPNMFGIPVGSVFVPATDDEDQPTPPDEGGNLDPPTEAQLYDMRKADLVAHVNAETDSDPFIAEDYGTKQEIIADFLEFRANGEWPEKEELEE